MLKDEFCTPEGSSGVILRGDADMAVFRYDVWTTDDGIFFPRRLTFSIFPIIKVKIPKADA